MTIYCTSFCNHGHRLEDGKPVDHECYVLPTEALIAERQGLYGRALAIMEQWKKKRPHKGVRSKEVG